MKRGIIFLAGDFLTLPPEITINCHDFVIAADGGYQHVIQLGIRPDLLLGDFDSLSVELYQRAVSEGIPMRTWPRDKDQTDGEIALREAVSFGCDRLIFFGGWGGKRLDHSLANLMLLELGQQLGVHVTLHHQGQNILYLLPGTYTICGEINQSVSLVPLSQEVQGITTEGFVYPLTQESLFLGQTRGMSNQFSRKEAHLTFESGKLWLIWHGKIPFWMLSPIKE